MNIKNYISSGILEAYVLGELSGRIKQEVERNADEYPEVYEEIRHIKEAFHIISVQSQKQAGIQPEVKYVSELPTKSIKEKKLKKSREIRSLKNKIKVSNYLATAALILAIISAFVAADLYLKLKLTQEKINSLYVENPLQENLNFELDYAADEEELESYNFLFSPNFKRIELYDYMDNRKSPHSWVYYNDKSHELFIQVSQLPEPDSDKQYQLWAIVDEKPVNAGLIPTENNEEFTRMRRIKNASEFLITLEPVGGSEFPDYNSGSSFRSLMH